MPLSKFLGAVLVMVIWGVNFAIIDIGLRSFDPYLLASLRFLLAAVPAVFFFKRPNVPWRYLLLYGLFFGIGQFGLLFAGMDLGFSAGLASVVMQLQAFWTIGLAAGLMGERVSPRFLVGFVVAGVGMGLVAAVTDGSVTAAGTVMVVGASLSWAVANLIIKKAQPENALAFTVWASLVPPVPMFLLSLGPAAGAPSSTPSPPWAGPASARCSTWSTRRSSSASRSGAICCAPTAPPGSRR